MLISGRADNRCAAKKRRFVSVTTKKTKKKLVKKSVPAAKRKPLKPATSASILGRVSSAKPVASSRAPVKIKPQWMKYYQNLLNLRNRLLNQMSGLAKDSAQEMASYSLHMADSGTDNFDRDFALTLLSSDQDAVFEIEEALKRIERDTFGVCELTNKNIPKTRLEVIPWTRFTVEAQAQLEREGALRQKRIAALGSMESTSVAESDDSDVEETDEKPAKEKE